jgi:hypothetical protein
MWWTGPMRLLQLLRNYCNLNEKFGQDVEQVERDGNKIRSTKSVRSVQQDQFETNSNDQITK